MQRPPEHIAARVRARRRRQLRRRRTLAGGAFLAAVVIVVLVVALTSGPAASRTGSGSGAGGPSGNGSPSGAGPSASGQSGSGHRGAHHRSDPSGSGVRVSRTSSAGPSAAPRSLEAGVEPWSLRASISREALVPDGRRLAILGGLDAASGTVGTVSVLDPSTGGVTAAGSLARPAHDAGGGLLAGRPVLYGGGSPVTTGTVQAGPGQTGGAPAGAPARVLGSLPQPRSDLAVATVASGAGRRSVTDYLVGGFDGGSHLLPEVLATTDGSHFSDVARLPVAVRYPAVAALHGRLYAFGGETVTGGTPAATDDIQMVDPATHRATVVGHLPQPLYGAAAFAIDGTLYVAGGETPGGFTETAIYAFEPSTGRVLDAGLLPQAVAFAGYTTLGHGSGAVGYLVGGEVSRQGGPDAAGVSSGHLTSVLSLRPSPYGGRAGGPEAGAPFRGTLLIADRGNDRLITLDPARRRTWLYPTASRPAPPGGFYFPDDAFFIRHGTGIISNQEDNHTIVEIGYPSGKLLWQYGHPGSPGSQPGYLNQPDDAYLLKSGVITVADASNNRILFISQNKRVLSQIGNGTDAHQPGREVAYPNGDTPLADGDVLVSEINGSWVDEYTPYGRMVWSVHLPSVNYPSDPQQLGSNRFLMTDYDPPAEGRVLEFNRQGRILWRYDATSGDGALKKPSLAERLPNGLIMVNDDYRDRVVAIDPRTDSIVWQYGLTDVPGRAPGQVSIPDGFDLLLPDRTTPTHPQTG